LRLEDAQAEALCELLQVFACGEESASLAFARDLRRGRCSSPTAWRKPSMAARPSMNSARFHQWLSVV
jgi:hypothetical protein